MHISTKREFGTTNNCTLRLEMLGIILASQQGCELLVGRKLEDIWMDRWQESYLCRIYLSPWKVWGFYSTCIEKFLDDFEWESWALIYVFKAPFWITFSPDVLSHWFCSCHTDVFFYSLSLQRSFLVRTLEILIPSSITFSSYLQCVQLPGSLICPPNPKYQSNSSDTSNHVILFLSVYGVLLLLKCKPHENRGPCLSCLLIHPQYLE